DDLRTILGETVGDAAFADDFFRRYITGQEAPDYTALLASAGILVRPARAGQPTIGMSRVMERDGVVTVAGPVLVGTSLYEAGVSTGDRIVSLDGRAIASEADVNTAVGGKRPGDMIEVVFEQRGVSRTARVTVGEDRTLEVVLYENAGMDVT